MSKAIIKKIAKARATGGGNYIKQGKGVLIVKSISLEELYNGDTFIAEFLVKSSESMPDAVDANGKPELANPAGTSCSYVQQLTKFESAPGNVKGFLEKLDGCEGESDEEFEGLLETYINKDPKAGEVNPARGFEIAYETFQRPIQKGKNAGKMITLVRWTHVDLDQDQVDANRALLDGKPVAASSAA
jgi:hypothetical protein